jgi:hypothetical protein
LTIVPLSDQLVHHDGIVTDSFDVGNLQFYHIVELVLVTEVLLEFCFRHCILCYYLNCCFKLFLEIWSAELLVFYYYLVHWLWCCYPFSVLIFAEHN